LTGHFDLTAPQNQRWKDLAESGVRRNCMGSEEYDFPQYLRTSPLLAILLPSTNPSSSPTTTSYVTKVHIARQSVGPM